MTEQWIDLRLIAGMRVVLGTSALLVVLIESMEARVWATPIHLTLSFYSLYGLLVYHLSVRRNPIVAHKIIFRRDICSFSSAGTSQNLTARRLGSTRRDRPILRYRSILTKYPSQHLVYKPNGKGAPA